MSAENMEVRWFQSKYSAVVHLYKDGRDQYEEQMAEYQQRTEFLKDDITSGSVSLRIHNIQPSDEGQYKCRFQSSVTYEEALLELQVADLGSAPAISVEGHQDRGIRVVCRSSGWYPQPKAQWRDLQGQLLPSASENISQEADGLFQTEIAIVLREESNQKVSCCVRNLRLNQERESAIYVTVDVTLDPDMANPWLVLSEDRKRVFGKFFSDGQKRSFLQTGVLAIHDPLLRVSQAGLVLVYSLLGEAQQLMGVTQLWRFLEEQERLLLTQLEKLDEEIVKIQKENITKLSEEISHLSEMEGKYQKPANEFLQDVRSTLSRYVALSLPLTLRKVGKELGDDVSTTSPQGSTAKCVGKTLPSALVTKRVWRSHLETTQLSLPAPRGRRAPAWSTPEVVDLLGLWGQDDVQAQLRNSRRNFDIYSQIARGMEEKGYDRDPQQCRLKIKELRQAYQKAKEANSRSGAEPQTCRFYKELHAIIDGDSTSTVKRPMDTLGDLESQGTGVNPEIEVMIKEEEEEEEEEYGGQATGGSGGVASQDFFLTPEQSSQSQQSSPGEPDAGEGTSAAANAALRASPSTPEERLGQVRRRKKRTREDMFQEVLRASRASEREQRAWRVMINDKMQRDSEDRRNGQQEMITLLREQTDMLRSLIELQAEHIRARLPLQPIENCIPGPPFTGLHVTSGPGAVPQALHPTEDYTQ
ncbi:Butyrophilin subfamily 2 member A1 [Chelonia mydas]|uniref:Butyrophilin subfamily 2 member A1 n=1 Tax=Chelonia mydas TaxID=8469 RepID=M7BBJ8_CHEMY|nr:Butyrophilin subfamily 2 member A1 [Chelonia mydas]